MTDRIAKLEDLLLREIAAYMAKARSGGIPGIVTITHVRLDKNLQSARVFYSVMGGSVDRDLTDRILMSLRRDMIMGLRKRLHLKRIPSLNFQFDTGPAQAAAVETVFERIRREGQSADHDCSAGESE
ncbi:MAG: ribosome-binding factor A [Elusimicrobiaceae bacterium]|nr:ribosome-binding factor A [Elusimicrobiaceae bacterium]